jgi:hypothetical protein
VRAIRIDLKAGWLMVVKVLEGFCNQLSWSVNVIVIFDMIEPQIFAVVAESSYT